MVDVGSLTICVKNVGASEASRGGNYYFGDQAPRQSGVKIVRRWEVGGRRLADKRVIGGAGLHCQHPQSHSGQRRGDEEQAGG